jgi:DNA (cytosine-5)-methyltransferase 1
LFFEIVRIAKYHKPEILFLENVKNYERHDEGRSLKVVYKTLEEIGYTVFHKVLNASKYGAATSRERIYILGFRKDLNIKDFKYPEPTNEDISLFDVLDKSVDVEEYKITREDIKFNEKNISNNLFGKSPNRPIQIGVINKGGQGERIYDPVGHAITLTAYGGGVAGKTGAYLVDGLVRKLTPNECRKVMGFPEDFIIPVSKSSAYKLFGNSVVVPVVDKVFNEVIKQING